MKILLLGAAGFIGTNLTIELAKKTEDEITLVDVLHFTIIKSTPVQPLTAAIAEELVLTLHGGSAPWTLWKFRAPPIHLTFILLMTQKRNWTMQLRVILLHSGIK